MKPRVTLATTADAVSIAALRVSTAEQLTRLHGRGHWSSGVTEASVLRSIRTSRVLAGREGTAVVATLTLATKKPWAIDPAYFTRVERALYFQAMAVSPLLQRRELGRELAAEAIAIARSWPADWIRLDAYDSAAGAGGFYAKCGFRKVGRVTYRNTPLVYYELVL